MSPLATKLWMHRLADDLVPYLEASGIMSRATTPTAP